MKENVEKYSSEIKEIHTTSRYLKTYNDSVKKECAAYAEQRNLHFENVSNITVNGDSVSPQKKKMGERNIVMNIIRFLTKNQTRV